MKRQQYKIRYFKCPVCGYIQTASKVNGRMTGHGHIKTMLCWKCFELRDFMQVSEWENQSITKTECP